MNRKEFATKIQDLINKAYLADVPKSYYKGLFDEAEKLRYPITLAEFLGWEENVEYDYKDLYVLKVENNRLFMKSEKCSSGWCNFVLFTDEIEDLQQATKVEKKLKAYHVKDEYSYKELMKELEEQGYIWLSNTESTVASYWGTYENNTVIYCEENKRLTYSNLDHFNAFRKNSYNLIEYKKEEPLYYAIDRIAKLDNDDNSYCLIRYYDEFSERYYFGTIEKESADKLTKTEWNELGINDSNADFEEVTE